MSDSNTDYWARDVGALWHPYTPFSRLKDNTFPLIVEARGPHLIADDGREYFDGIASWWSASLGHSHPRIVDAIREQASAVQHTILGGLTHPSAIELAERLSALNGGDRRTIFASDGASAVEAGLRVALHYQQNIGETARTRFASLQNAYHGDTIGTVSVGYLEHFHAGIQDALVPVHRIAPPYQAGMGMLSAENGDDAATPDLDRFFDAHGKTLAACVVEPICQCAAGMMMYPPSFLRALSERCRAEGVLLIVDEIATGFARTGTRFAYEQAGIRPDVVVTGKALTGGAMPVSAASVDASIYSSFDDTDSDRTLYHGHTFAGHPIGCAAACAALEVYDEIDIVGCSRAGSEVLSAALDGLRAVAGIADLRLLGMIAAVEFDTRPARAQSHLLEHGIITRPLGDVLYLMPPLNTDIALLKTVADVFVEACALQAASE